MALPDLSGEHVHDEGASLVWYASGALEERERRAVERHLESCAECRAELQSVLNLRGQLRGALDSEPGPSARVRQSVLERIHLAPATPVVRAPRAALAPAAPSGLERWLRSLLAPHWAPAAALVLLLAQAGVLVWMLPGSAPQPPQVGTRGLGVAPTRLRLVFNPLATEAQIRAVLRGLDAHIVDGPGASGTYLIELSAADPKAVSGRLQVLRSHTDVVQLIDVALP